VVASPLGDHLHQNLEVEVALKDSFLVIHPQVIKQRLWCELTSCFASGLFDLSDQAGSTATRRKSSALALYFNGCQYLIQTYHARVYPPPGGA
jgi:hypothetical protein